MGVEDFEADLSMTLNDDCRLLFHELGLKSCLAVC